MLIKKNDREKDELFEGFLLFFSILSRVLSFLFRFLDNKLVIVLYKHLSK